MNRIAWIALLLLPFQEPSVEKLLEQLKSDRAAERDRAEGELKLRGESAAPALEVLSRDVDPELAARAKSILAAQATVRTVTPALAKAIPDARKRLSSGGHAATLLLIEALTHPQLGRDDFLPLALPAAKGADKEERVAVSNAISGWQLTPGVQAILPWLDEKEWEVRRHVLDAVEFGGDREVGPALMARVRSSEYGQWSIWVGLMARMGLREVLPEIMAALQDQGRNQERRLGEDIYPSLALMGAYETVPAMLRGLHTGMTSHAMVAALQQLAPDEILPSLIEDASSRDPLRGPQALHFLTTGFVTAAALPFYRKLLEDPTTRAAGVTGIANLRRRDLLPDLVNALEDQAPIVRMTAATMLASFGDRNGLPELVMALKKPETAIQAMSSLRRLGAKEAVPDLLPFLKSPDLKVRGQAIDVLGAIGAAEVRPIALAGLRDPSAEIRSNSAVALTNLDGKKAIPLLIPLLDDPDFNISRNTAPQMLIYLKSQEVLPRLLIDLKSGDPDRTASALWQINAIDPEQAWPHQIEALKGDVRLRSQAAAALAYQSRPEALPTLQQLQHDGDLQIRRSVVLGLIRLGDRSPVSWTLRDPGYWGTHFELNLLRRPEICKAWRGKILSGPDIAGSNRDILEEICRKNGIQLEMPADLPWQGYGQDLQIEGRDLLSLIEGLIWGAGGAVVEEGKLILLPPRQFRQFWLRWWGEELKKSPIAAEREEGEAFLESVEESNRRLAEWKKTRATNARPKPEELRALLTPVLKILPGIEDRLVNGGEAEWMRVFNELQNNSEVGRADLEALAPRALRGAATTAELTQILTTGAWKKLSNLRPLAPDYLKNPSGEVRIAAARLILMQDGARALPEVLGLLDDPDGNVRYEFVNLIGNLRILEAVPQLRAHQDDPKVRNGMIHSAGYLGLEEYLPEILVRMKRAPNREDNYIERMSLVFSLIQLGNPSNSDEVLDLLKAEDHPNVVDTEIRTLASWGCKAAIPQITHRLSNPGRMGDLYAYAACEALVQLGAREAAPAILDQLNGENRQLDHAASAAARLGLVEAIPKLRKLLATVDLHRFPGIAPALGQLGDQGSREALRKLLDYPKKEHSEPMDVRGGAALALVFLGDKESFPAIVALAKDQKYPDAWLQAIALMRRPEYRTLLVGYYINPPGRGYASVAAGGEPVLEEFRKRLQDQDRNMRIQAVRGLGYLEAGGEAELKAAMTGDAEEDVRQEAGMALCRRGVKDGVGQAWALTRHPFRNLPFNLNAVRSPSTWAKLKAATLKEPFSGTAKDLVVQAAAAAGLPLEELPATSPEFPAWANVHVQIPAVDLPISGLDAIERAQQSRWMLVLETDRVRVVGRKDAIEFWGDWVAKEKR